MRAYRRKFAGDRLTAAALERPEVEAQGILKLGAFAGLAYLTPVQPLQLKRAEDAAAA
ncbi:MULTISPECIES: hypothetical protein [unclassified Acidovorax]|uniref:hypothetical protein n=1 Tax=unclassified Acidovorax TaxID=2684926 RepID=UPI000B27D76A|nr:MULTISPECIES: hypothetical protein [unclassified Acidovorax]